MHIRHFMSRQLIRRMLVQIKASLTCLRSTCLSVELNDAFLLGLRGLFLDHLVYLSPIKIFVDVTLYTLR